MAELLNLLLLIGLVPFLLLYPSALGKVFFSQASWAERSVFGWIFISCLVSLMASFGMAKQAHLLTTTAISALFFIPYFVEDFKSALRARAKLKEIFFQENILFKSLFLFAALLLITRLTRSFLPCINWDTLGYHFTTAREFLQQGSLNPLFYLPTDRRVPLGGVLIKVWLMIWDEFGRAILIANLCMAVVSLRLFYQIVCTHLNPRWAWLGVFMLMSLPDMFVHIATGGDEALLQMLVLATFKILLEKDHLSFKQHVFIGVCLGFSLSVKLTALFFIPFLFIFWLIKSRHQHRGFITGLFFMLLLAGVWHVRSLSHYGMIYPLTRWTNLTSDQSGGSLMQAKLMRADRAFLGLSPDINDRPLTNRPLGRLTKNIRTFFMLPLGPYLSWCILISLFTFLFRKKENPPFKKNRLSLAEPMVYVCLLFGLSVWPFSPQAMMRYFIPLWPILFIYITLQLYRHLKDPFLQKHFSIILSLLLISSLSLEVKFLLPNISAEAFLKPTSVWTQSASDGKLIAKFLEIREEGDVTFYAGPSSFLLDGPCWYAQVGNEVGWRRPTQIHRFLKKNKIAYWLISKRCDAFDQSYSALTRHLQKQGVLQLVESLPQGKIFRVRTRVSL